MRHTARDRQSVNNRHLSPKELGPGFRRDERIKGTIPARNALFQTRPEPATTRLTLFLIAAACLALSACASLAPYGTQTGPGGQGHVGQGIESSRFRITRKGGA